jgi:hypothetical protein
VTHLLAGTSSRTLNGRNALTSESRIRQLARSLLVCLVALAVPVVASTQEAAGEPPANEEQGTAVRDGSHDFDFEFGEWTVQLSRLERPLTGSDDWVHYRGTSVVRKVWEGSANLGELEVDGGPGGRIQGLSLRLYDPESRQWNIHWASRRDGALGEAMVGSFENGIGEFYNQEELDGRSIFVRFVFSEIMPTSFRLEQAFSEDGGKTWEANWIAEFER